MNQLQEVKNLYIVLTPLPPDAPPNVIATFALFDHESRQSPINGLLLDPLSPNEHKSLYWYLEEYWKWPYLEFATRGRQVEALLVEVGQRLYRAAFGSVPAQDLVKQWLKQPERPHQITIVSDLPRVLGLPWELLHDEHSFVALDPSHPISIVRSLPQDEQSVVSKPFEPPLRILLVTARPQGEGFIDPRSIAHELLDEIQDQVENGTIALEFLRPPTLKALRSRLGQTEQPVHVLHFDGHGKFDEQQEKQGTLLFETETGLPSAIKAGNLANLLGTSGVQLVVLTACQSAVGATDDAFSSVAMQLLRNNVDAVVAMSASVLVVTASRYVEAFYRSLATGTSVPVAQEMARRALHDDPRRHILRRRSSEEGHPVELQDWWLPHFYQQRPLILQPTPLINRHLSQHAPYPFPRLSNNLFPQPSNGLSGYARELLQVERALQRQQLVVLHGFSGGGKTALAHEAADWLTRTDMYDGACLISFENGGDVGYLLNELEKYLGQYDDNHSSDNALVRVKRLKTALTARHILMIVDNVETILPRGNAPLEENACTELYTVLCELRDIGTGIILICLDIGLSKELKPDGRIVYLPLQGLHPEDAYILASRLLEQLHIDRTNVPFPELSALLTELHYHPLAIQRVLPALREHSVEEIRAHFDKWLPMFRDDAETGRHYSLVTSLNYSLRRLTEEQQSKLPLLAPFEEGASEEVLLAITQIPEQEWKQLRQALEQAALVIPESVYLRFHPVFAPFLRSRFGIDAALRERYMQLYLHYLYYLYQGQSRDPRQARALMRQELPNLLRALYFSMERESDLETSFRMANILATFLNVFGMEYERDQLLKRVAAVAAIMRSQQGEGLAKTEWISEITAGQDEIAKGNLRAATTRFTTLLARMEALPEGSPLGAGSFEHSMTLTDLAQCFIREETQHAVAEKLLRKALDNMDRLLRQQPDDRDYLNERAAILGDLGSVLSHLGQRGQARTMFEEALKIHTLHGDLRNQAAVLGDLGILAAIEDKSDEAKAYYMKARDIFRELNEPAMEAVAWYRLGRIAEECGELEAAEQYFRESLILRERHADVAGIPDVLNYLALVARRSGRPSEAESWYKRALALDEQLYPQSYLHACHYNDLAFLLMSEVRDGRAPKLRLAEAKDYAQRALAIMETLDPSAEIWAILGTLADIASLERRPEIEHNYRRRARETYAAYEGNRDDIDRRYGSNILGVVAAAKGNAEARRQVEGILPDAEQDSWHITAAVQRIWAGERDWHALVENLDLDVESALLVLRVLELLAQPTEEPEQVFASLPAEMHQAMKQNDPSAFQQAFNALPLEKKMAIGEALHLSPRFTPDN